MYALERTKLSSQKDFDHFPIFEILISEAPIIAMACRARSWGLAGKRTVASSNGALARLSQLPTAHALSDR